MYYIAIDPAKKFIYIKCCFGYIIGDMSLNKFNYQSAVQDFNEARLKASLEEALARLTGKSNELLSYDEVAQKLKLRARSDQGVHEIPLNAIVGSVGRYTDFTRTFLPLKP